MPADPKAYEKIAPETIARMSAELVGVSIPEKDQTAVANLLQSLGADMTAMRAMNVGVAEPAFVYDASEAES